MNMELTPIELRILGCLIEKEIATPDHYPLTLNALVNACNQKSNRNPVMELDESSVIRTLDALRMDHKLAFEVHSSGSRVAKYKHGMTDHGDFTPAQTAILCELILRGPQTAGDLRARASRLHPLTDHFEVESILQELTELSGEPLVLKLPREPGKRENKWTHLLGGPIEPEEKSPQSTALPAQSSDNLEELKAEVADLRSELDELKITVAELKSAFE